MSYLLCSPVHPCNIYSTLLSCTVYAINNKDAIVLAQNNNEDSKNDVSSWHNNNSSALIDVLTNVKEVLYHRKEVKKAKYLQSVRLLKSIQYYCILIVPLIFYIL